MHAVEILKKFIGNFVDLVAITAFPKQFHPKTGLQVDQIIYFSIELIEFQVVFDQLLHVTHLFVGILNMDQIVFEKQAYLN